MAYRTTHGRLMDEPNRTLIRDWMDAHGIDYAVAAECGLYGHREGSAEILCAPYYDIDGKRFYRTRRFTPDEVGPWKQPAGQPLRLWWPLGAATGLPVLLCEGEGDALAASTAVFDTDTNTVPELLDAICPVALPGASMNAIAVVASLILWFCPRVYVCLDGDEAGRKATDRIVKAAANASLDAVPVFLPEGYDLSESMPVAEERLEWLGNLLLDAEIGAEEARDNIVMGSIKDKLKINQKDSGSFA